MFLDTSGLLCLHCGNEPRHADAFELFEAAGQMLTHGGVLSELITLALIRGLPRPATLEFVRELMMQPDVEIIWPDGNLHEQALALLAARPDKRYSFCDAVSFVLMREHGILEALTTDHHFDQEGFIRLLRP
jgi:predicted nucleic acid-binding protein